MNFPGPCFRVDDNAKSYEPAFVVFDLTFLHISFAILFCQKKSRKTVSPSSGFSIKKLIRGTGKDTECMYLTFNYNLPVGAVRIYHYTSRTPTDRILTPMGIKKQQGAESFPCSLLLTRIPCLTELRLICRGARLIQSAFCDHEHDVKPIRGDRSLSTFSHGNRACSLSFCCEAETFFSFSI